MKEDDIDQIVNGDINDDEIRIIGNPFENSEGDVAPTRKPKRRWKWIIYFLLAIIICLGIAVTALVNSVLSKDEIIEQMDSMSSSRSDTHASRLKKFFAGTESQTGYVGVSEVEWNGIELQILYPQLAAPSLEVGASALNDDNIIMAVRAADVREDNGEIAGAFVKKGEIISKGEVKAGFCSIIDGNLLIGVADSTPMFEQALTSGGDFFRQYPLVVGGQIVENKPKGKAIRKALAELNGGYCVIISKERMTFHDFSEALVSAGVQNAINLCGGGSSGFYITHENNKVSLGIPPEEDYDNSSYIIWKR